MVGVVTFDRRGEISACSRTLQIFEAVGVSAQPVFICSKLKIETLEQGVKYVRS